MQGVNPLRLQQRLHQAPQDPQAVSLLCSEDRQLLQLWSSGTVSTCALVGVLNCHPATISRRVRQLLQSSPLPSLDLSTLPLPEALACDCLDPLPLENALDLLNQFGLGEVYTYLSPASHKR